VLTADARFAVSADSDHAARVWQLDTGRCLRTLAGHHDSLSGLAIASDASRVLTAAHDRTVRLWELDWNCRPEQSPAPPVEPRRFIPNSSRRPIFVGRLVSLAWCRLA
jgi:WD40 repeat protein